MVEVAVFKSTAQGWLGSQREKGEAAEGRMHRPGVLFWHAVEYAAFCHGHVERYHGYPSFLNLNHE